MYTALGLYKCATVLTVCHGNVILSRYTPSKIDTLVYVVT